MFWLHNDLQNVRLQVYRAQYNGEDIALKLYSGTGPDSYSDMYRDLRDELDILTRIDHTNVVAIRGVTLNL